MAEVIRFRSTPQQQTPAVKLTVGRDEYSVKVTSEADPRFWVRLELGGGRDLVVTDFNPGDSGESALIEGLLLALRDAGAGSLDTITFKDVVPGVAGPHQGARLIEARTVAEKAARLAARERGQAVEFAKLEEIRGKLSVRIGFR